MQTTDSTQLREPIPRGPGDDADVPFTDISAARLARLSEIELSKLDIARLNLRCAIGLPGAENLNFVGCMKTLDWWTDLVRQNTEKWWPDFVQSPEKYEHSPARFRMSAMVTLLKRDLRLRYYMPFSEGEYNGTDSRNLFLHGIFSGHGGTCVTLPILYIAIGRRLGYPLRLVAAKEHLFIRWDDPGGDRFNVEATSPGYAQFDDEHYKTWPVPLDDEDFKLNWYLRNLTPHEEVGVFFLGRAVCLFENLRFREAIQAAWRAGFFTPDLKARLTWQMATLILRGIEQVQRRSAFDPREPIDLATLPLPEPKKPWEFNAAIIARLQLRRLATIHGEKVVLPDATERFPENVQAAEQRTASVNAILGTIIDVYPTIDGPRILPAHQPIVSCGSQKRRLQ